MLLVDDLQVERDVLPLFNFTYHEHAEAALWALFRERPPTLAAVRERQAIIQGFLGSWPVLENFCYPLLYLRGTHAFLADVQSKRLLLPTSPTARWRLLFSPDNRQQVESLVVQLVLFLDTLHTRYFSRLNPADFPPAFATELTAALAFLAPFDLGIHAAAIGHKTFTINQILYITRQVQALRAEDIQQFWAFCYRFEAYWSVAKGMRQHQLCLAELDAQCFDITDFYHPLLPHAVRNSFRQPPGENVVLLTGPNMAGKSTLLKSLSLCVYLAHLGLGVPAAACVVPYFDVLAVSIDLRDDLRSGYSHFMTELRHLKTVVEQAAAGRRCFAVFDELFRGTNPDDALDITGATLCGLARFPQSVFFISTHLLQLEQQLAAAGAAVGAYCIECALVKGRPVFSYRLRRGWSRLKIGRRLFDEVGLSDLLGRADEGPTPQSSTSTRS